MQILWYVLSRARDTVLWAAGLSILSGAATVAMLALIVKVLRGHAEVGPILVALVVLAAIASVLRNISANSLTRFSRRHASDLSEQLARHLVCASLRDVERLGPDRIVATLTGDITTITNAIALAPAFIVSGATAVGALAYLAVLSPGVFVVVLLMTTLASAAKNAVTRSARARLLAAREEDDALLGHFRALTSGISELKLH